MTSQKKIEIGAFPVAVFGMRFQLAAKAVPKAVLSIMDRLPTQCVTEATIGARASLSVGVSKSFWIKPHIEHAITDAQPHQRKPKLVGAKEGIRH
jgi:UTP-glucose-1-phosphate uridylyltransferase